LVPGISVSQKNFEAKLRGIGRLDLSIIIPCHRLADTLFELIDSIQSQENPPSYEIFVVANPPEPLLRRRLAEVAGITYLENEIPGANAARNKGLDAATGSIVLFIDDDCVLRDPGFLRRHCDAHLSRPELAGLGGHYELPAKAGLADRVYHLKQLSWIRSGMAPGYRSDLLFGGNMSFKRNALGSIRFDPALCYGGTETELIFRLASTGLRTALLPNIPIEHRTHTGTWGLLKKAYRQGQGARYLQEKGFNGIRPVLRALSKPQAQVPIATAFLGKVYDAFYHGGLAAPITYGNRIPAWRMLSGGIFYLLVPVRHFFKRIYFVEFWGVLNAAVTLRKRDKRR